MMEVVRKCVRMLNLQSPTTAPLLGGKLDRASITTRCVLVALHQKWEIFSRIKAKT